MATLKKLKSLAKNILLIFLYVSIGFLLGKHSVSAVPGHDVQLPQSVQVYYMHATFRCATCNKIEKMTRELLAAKYKDLIDAGKLKFTEVDFQKDENLAKQFDVSSSCVVVAKSENGAIVEFKRLDKVWELLTNKKEFDIYLSLAIDSMLNGGKK